MEIITIESKNKSVLYQMTAQVEVPLTESTKKEIETMRIFYKSVKDKAGFAAPQVGISKKIILVEKNLFDKNTVDETSEPAILINPSWKPLSDEKELDIEGCLSVPGKVGVVARYINVELTALLYCPATGKVTEIKRQYHREFSSVLWQHEVDHLNGTIYADKAKLLLSRSDFDIFRQYLADVGQLQDKMALFDIGALIYNLEREWRQQPVSIQEFLQHKMNAVVSSQEMEQGSTRGLSLS